MRDTTTGAGIGMSASEVNNWLKRSSEINKLKEQLKDLEELHYDTDYHTTKP